MEPRARILILSLVAAIQPGCICGAIANPDPSLLEGADDAGIDGSPDGGCGSDTDCHDGIDCTADLCPDDGVCTHFADDELCEVDELCLADTGCIPRRPCESAADCQDATVCDGEERCERNVCLPGDALECDDGRFCNGAETCDPEGGCQPGPVPDCSDGVDCTLDSCDPEEDECVHDPSDAACSDGEHCNGVESCDATNGCEPGTPPCDDGVDCTVDQCVEAEDECLRHADHGSCGPGELCHDGGAGFLCEAVPCSEPADCDDGDGCNGVETCGKTGFCEAGGFEPCDDGFFCSGAEYCDADGACQDQPPPSCSDGVDCTIDSCDVGSDACAHAPSHVECADGSFCSGDEVCSALGCEDGPPPDCDDGSDCTVDACVDPGGCSGSPRDADADGHGDLACGGDDCDDGDALVSPEAEEICNGADDDCSGTADDGLECARGTALACETGCGSTGTRTCSVDCAWGGCDAPPEDCNGVDDDCDDEVDEGCDCDPADPTDCLTSCGTTGTRQCVAGEWTACDPPDEACNGLDDDCDLEPDNGFDCPQAEVEPCTTACGSSGERTCSDACEWGSCAPPLEICNGEDDDCALGPDDVFDCVQGSSEACVTGCLSAGTRTCSGSCTWGSCVAPAEICNGDDDDCDGQCDETSQCCAGAATGCQTACDTTGTSTCTNACTPGACVPPNEICNGQDDDCDGRCDDGFTCCAGAAGTACLTDCNTLGIGVCNAQCQLIGGNCSEPVEICNGRDDDCDDNCDEGGGRQCCAGVDLRECSVVGGGDPVLGTQTCMAACLWSACCAVTEQCGNGLDDDCDGQMDGMDPQGCCSYDGGIEESCNGQDDDCNGLCDDGGGDMECCRGTSRGCRTSCNTVGTRRCDNDCEWDDCEPPDEICDNGFDDDCDGDVDAADPDC
ncbi:MAG: hypothetical protein HYY06_15165 [Deltaproteobacteria bacterium]|nr:hypothetical protein [Deltaproteobacteria bacterium]